VARAPVRISRLNVGAAPDPTIEPYPWFSNTTTKMC